MSISITEGKYKTEDSYELSEDYVENILCRVFPERTDRYFPAKSRLIGDGSWIMVIRSVPVDPIFRPLRYHIYWATPCLASKNMDGFDKYGRYKIEIHVLASDDSGRFDIVGLFPDEYMVVSEKFLNESIELGEYQLQPSFYSADSTFSLPLIEKGKTLVEEERDIIRSLMLDGLTEHQACQEYFLYTHVNDNNVGVLYVPTKEMLLDLQNTFGE